MIDENGIILKVSLLSNQLSRYRFLWIQTSLEIHERAPVAFEEWISHSLPLNLHISFAHVTI